MVDAMNAREMRALGEAFKQQAGQIAVFEAASDLLTLTGDAYLAAAVQLDKDAERFPDVIAAMSAILSLIGNVDHSKGNGPNAAEMRGHLLNDIRTIATVALRP